MTSRIFRVVEEVTITDYGIAIGTVALNFTCDGTIYLSDSVGSHLGSYYSKFWIEQ